MTRRVSLAAVLLIAGVLLTGVGLLVFLNAVEGNLSPSAEPELPVDQVGGDSLLDLGAEGVSLQALPSETIRTEISAEDHFWRRYRELVADGSYRQSLRAPQEAQLARSLEQGLPLPFAQVCSELVRRGVVPPPEADSLLEFEMFAIQSAAMLLGSQAQSLTEMKWDSAGEALDGLLERYADSAATLAPEVLGTLIQGLDIRDEIRHSDQLRMALESARTNACIAYGLAWTELEFFRHCAFQASLESGMKLPNPLERDVMLAGEHQEMAAAVARLQDAHRTYLAEVATAVSQHFSE